LLSTIALTVAVVLMSNEASVSPSGLFAGLAPASASWLALAAFLRVGVYPLPNRHGKMWEVDLASVCTGVYLWLQVGAVPSSGLARLPALVIAISLLAMGLLAGRATDFASAWPRISTYSVLLSLSPMVMGGEGAVVATLSLMAVWALCLGLRHLYIGASVPSEIAPWWRTPMIVALAALSGLPPTVGFTARRALLGVCWRHGRWDLILALSAASLLVANALWQQLDRLLVSQDNHECPRWPRRVSLVTAALMAAALLVGGICPRCLGPILQGEESLPLTSSPGLIRKGLLLLLTSIPPLGGYALHRMRGRFSPKSRPWLNQFDFLVSLEWLYGTVEAVLDRVGRGTRNMYVAVEESLGLGWIVLWALALTLYLVGR
jgi:hypothetical protein